MANIRRSIRQIVRVSALTVITHFWLHSQPGNRLQAQSCQSSCPSSCNSEAACSGGAYAPADYCLYPDTGCYTGNPASQGCCCNDSPIVFDLEGTGVRLTSAADGVHFQIGPVLPTAYRIAWTLDGSSNAWLALDRNKNGRIDDITELFGNKTEQPSSDEPNGFLALALLDSLSRGGNGDGLIDERDAIYESLVLWRDLNHNGISEPSELSSLAQVGVRAISLSYAESRRLDQYSNRFRFRSKLITSRGTDAWAWDVFLTTTK